MRLTPTPRAGDGRTDPPALQPTARGPSRGEREADPLRARHHCDAQNPSHTSRGAADSEEGLPNWPAAASGRAVTDGSGLPAGRVVAVWAPFRPASGNAQDSVDDSPRSGG